MIGFVHTVKCHRSGGDLILDSWERTTFSYQPGSFVSGTAIVSKTDVAGTLDDAYIVKFLYEDGDEPGDDSSRLSILIAARFEIDSVLNDQLDGLVKIA